MYNFFYYMMIIGYLYCSIQAVSIRMKIIGVLLTIVNGVLFYKG